MTETATSFTLFPLLPKELQLKIFEFVEILPRVIELSWSAKERTIVSRTPPPAPLHACIDSRITHEKKFGQLEIGTSSQVIPIDWARDTIFFEDNRYCMVITGARDFDGDEDAPWYSRWAPGVGRMNPKLLRDISRSKSLFKHAQHVAFDSGFLENFDITEQAQVLSEIYTRLLNVHELLVVPKREWEKTKKVRKGCRVTNMQIEEMEGTANGRWQGHAFGILGLNVPVRIMGMRLEKEGVGVKEKKKVATRRGSLTKWTREIFSRRRSADGEFAQANHF